MKKAHAPTMRSDITPAPLSRSEHGERAAGEVLAGIRWDGPIAPARLPASVFLRSIGE